MIDQGLIDADKLAQITGKPVRTIREHGHRRKWSQKKISGRGKGGINVKYETEEIDPEYKAPYFQETLLGYASPLILPLLEELDQDLAKELIDRYERAPEWCKQRAYANNEVRKSFETFSKNKKKVFSKIEFSRLYNGRNESLGITDETFNLIPKMSKGRLKKIISKYKTEGLAGLLPSPDRGKPKAKINDEIRAIILSYIKKNPGIRAVRVYEYLQDKFSGTGIPIPCYRTVLNFIKNWKEQEAELYCHMRSPDMWRSKYKAAFGSQSQKAEYFLDMLELDATVADVQCADGKRYKISAAIDIFSRKVKFIVVPVHDSLSIGCTLLRWVMLNWGIPNTILRDNGKEYVSRHIDLLCDSLDINRSTLPPFSPEQKPHVERVIGSLAVGLFEELDGFVGHNVAERKNIESRKSFAQRMFTKGEIIECRLTPDELQKAIDIWAGHVYHQRIHSELGMSPEQKASQSTQKVQKIKDERILDILLSPGGSRTVSKKGISFENGKYIAIELAEYIGQKVELRLDLTNAGKIFVFDTESKFLCIAEDTALKPFTVEEIRAAGKRQKNRIKEKEKAIKILREPDENPMIEHLEAKRKAPGQIKALIPEVPFENLHTREARKALDFENAEPVSTFITEIKKEEKLDKIIHLKKKEDISFENELERYKHLKKKDVSEITEKDRSFIKRYEGSDEYDFLFRKFEQQGWAL
ncbi:MAG: Mu transposase C-terminal domain-containing protein [Desulfobacterales bacterium]|nr:Mu transposase C-terminal domain-containing protein [Desulfobacterales bacterium]